MLLGALECLHARTRASRREIARASEVPRNEDKTKIGVVAREVATELSSRGVGIAAESSPAPVREPARANQPAIVAA